MGKESLIIFQNTLCKLYTDGLYRNEFLTNKEEFLHQLQVDPSERKLLEGIDDNELIRYADSLIYKRLNISKKIIPELYSIPETDIFFYDFARRVNLEGTDKHINDSLLFLAQLKPKDKIQKELIRILKHGLKKESRKNYCYFNIYRLDLNDLRDYITDEFIVKRHLLFDIKILSYHITFQKHF